MTNNIAMILLNMSVFEKERHCIFRVPCFIHVCTYSFGYQIGLKLLGIFLGLGFRSTFGTPPQGVLSLGLQETILQAWLPDTCRVNIAHR